MVIGNTLMTIIIKRRNPIWTITIGHPSETMATNVAIKMATKAISQEGLRPGSMKSSLIVSAIWSTQPGLTWRSTERKRLNLHPPHQKLSCPSQDMEYVPKPLRGSAFNEEVIRHSSSHVSTPTLGSETEIVPIGRRSQNECTVITVIGASNQKVLWDSSVGRCIISCDCYNSLHP